MRRDEEHILRKVRSTRRTENRTIENKKERCVTTKNEKYMTDIRRRDGRAYTCMAGKDMGKDNSSYEACDKRNQ